MAPVEGPLTIKGDTCGGINVPLAHTTVGIENTDLIVYITSENNTKEGYVAYASACYLESGGLNQVIAGMVMVNMAQFSGNSFETQYMTLVHEITHLLGFSSGLFPYFHNRGILPRNTIFSRG